MMKESMVEMFEAWDKYMSKQTADTLVGGDDIDEETYQEVIESQNESMKLYRTFRSACIKLAEKEDERFNQINDKLESIEKMIMRK